MPTTPPQSYRPLPVPPQGIRADQVNDSILVAQHRLRKKIDQDEKADIHEDWESTPRVAEVRPRDPSANSAPAPLPGPQRAPQVIPTHVLHRNLPAIEERAEQNAMVRMIRRITVSENKLTPEQKADAIIDWLVHNQFMTMTTPGRASQLVTKFYGHDTSKSRLFESGGVYMNTTMPWLKKEQVRAIRTILIDRVHCNKADPGATTPSAHECLVRYFKAIRDERPIAAVSQVSVRPSNTMLMRISAYHMEDVFFDQGKSLSGGQQGAFYAGVTRSGYPVGIKRIHGGGDAEIKAMRHLQVGGYLQAHHGETPAAPSWVVMPCYSGTLLDLAPLFLEVPYKPQSGHSGGLRGARYIFQNILGELAFLHDEMNGIHQDIKSLNIFVSQRQKRFILGDLGLSARLSIRGDAPRSGLTLGYASPEQMAENQRLTPASDVFSACVTVANGVLQADPKVDQTWYELYPDVPKPHALFPSSDEKTAAAFAAWAKFSDGDDTLQRIQDNFELTQLAHTHVSKRSYHDHYARVAAVMTELDTPLWNALRCGLKADPKARLRAKELQKKIIISQRDWQKCEAVWDQMAPYSPKIDQEIKRLKTILGVR